jgi:hypothetical protein
MRVRLFTPRAIAATVAESNHVLLAGDHFKATGNRLGNYQVKAVGAYVQRRNELAHSFRR